MLTSEGGTGPTPAKHSNMDLIVDTQIAAVPAVWLGTNPEIKYLLTEGLGWNY